MTLWVSCNRITGTVGYKGVCWDKDLNKWRVKITLNYKTIYIGIYLDEIKAAKAYDKAAVKYYGEFACPNFPKNRRNKND